MDIYICVVDFESQFQTTLLAESMNFFVWKFKSITLIFLLFFARIVKSTAFCTLLLLSQNGWNCEVVFLRKNPTGIFQLIFLQIVNVQITTVCRYAPSYIWKSSAGPGVKFFKIAFRHFCSQQLTPLTMLGVIFSWCRSQFWK